MKLQYVLLFSFFLLAATCNQDDDMDAGDRLPEATMEGKNTFGCLVNGEVWIPGTDYDFWTGDETFKVQYDDERLLLIRAWKRIPDQEISERLILYIDYYPNASSSLTRSTNFAIVGINCNNALLIDTMSYHNITITHYDKPNKIIAGTFELTVLTEGCSDTLHITNGRFDLEYTN